MGTTLTNQKLIVVTNFGLTEMNSSCPFIQTTINFKTESDNAKFYWKKVYIDSCVASKSINYHPMFRPFFLLTKKIHLSNFHDIGLIFHKTRMRFSACHRKQLHWTTQLKELVIVFDYFTWSLLVAVIYVLSRIQKLILQKVIKKNI